MPNWIVKGNILSDYLSACREADMTTFKQDKRFKAIFEHCPLSIAENYWEEIPDEMKRIGFTNDFYGSPIIREFGQYRYSTSTVQYIGVLSRLIKNFGPLDGLRICEIGGGYGGQCRTVLDVYEPSCYHIIDLPEVSELQNRYLTGTIAECFTEPTGQDYDLIISNYALSEVPNNKLYIDHVLMRSKHGYITCNTDLVKIDWNHSICNDIAGEVETNYIIIW